MMVAVDSGWFKAVNFRAILSVCVLLGLHLCQVENGLAQDKPATSNKSAKKKGDELKPRLETLNTRDGVPLGCGYFPSDAGKEAVPVVIVHEWGGRAEVYAPLALALQKVGCAVILVDLRGHGYSQQYMDNRGQIQQFNQSKLGRKDVQSMINVDLETVKKFLKQENDDEKLNLNALTFVGIGEGAIMAANYAVIDWNFPDVGNKKQSKDVRALIAVSPPRTLEGFGYELALRHPLVSRLPWLFVVGQESPEAREAERLNKQLERVRKAGLAYPAELKAIDSDASNLELVTKSADVIPAIVDFVKANVVDNQQQFPWVDRSGE